MADIRVGYTTSDYFYTLESDKVPSHQTCERKYKLDFDTSCAFLPVSEEIKHCILDFSNESGRIDSQCLRDVDVRNQNKTDYFKKYTTWLDSSANCYTAALCKNREYAEKIQEQQSRHLGSNQNYENVLSLLTNEQWKSIQLGLGLLCITGAIFYIQRKSNT